MPSKPTRMAARLAGRLAWRAARRVAGPALVAGAERLIGAAKNAGEAGEEVLDAAGSRRLPIQRGIDVAVPLPIVWDEWIALVSLPEGAHVVTGIELDGDTLTGSVRGRDWEAEVLDLRPQQSFAWQSHDGSDCAGLATFHELSERLTRIELNLDVVPTGLGESLQLLTRLADRRAEAELRRFKARVELIDPDVYADELAEIEEEASGESENDAEPELEAGDAEESDAADETEEEDVPAAEEGEDTEEDPGSGSPEPARSGGGSRSSGRKRSTASRTRTKGHDGARKGARARSRGAS